MHWFFTRVDSLITVAIFDEIFHTKPIFVSSQVSSALFTAVRCAAIDHERLKLNAAGKFGHPFR